MVASLLLVLAVLVAQSTRRYTVSACCIQGPDLGTGISSGIDSLPVIECPSGSAQGGHKKTRKKWIEQALKCTSSAVVGSPKHIL